jgi:hypothetical protein
MMDDHLTDEEIQDILDGNRSQVEPSRKHHLETCDTCQQTLKQYRALYAHLESDTGFKLPKHFAKSVVAKLTSESSSPFSFPASEVIIIVAGIAIALGAAFLFVDLKPFFNFIARISLPRLGFNASFMAPIKNMLSDLNGSLILLPFAGLALLSVALFDRFIHKIKHQKMPL